MPLEESNLLLELLAIFVGAKALGGLFERLALPGVLGEILAGMVLGPYALHVVSPGATTMSLAQLGAIFLLFAVGLETQPGELRRVGQRALIVAVSGVVIPFLMGFLYMRLAGRSPQEAVFLAVALVATSVGITARVLADMKANRTRAAKIILGAAVFDDILGLLLLAVVTGLGSPLGVRWVHLGLVLVEAAGFACFMIFLAPHLIHRICHRIERASSQNVPLILAFIVCLGLSGVAEKIGMAAIVGAFFAGLVFADFVPRWNLREPVRGMTQLLTPFFFFTMGAYLDLPAITAKVLAGALIVSALAVVSKLIGCGLPMLREDWRTALQVGVGMVPRGEVGLIVALVGLNTHRLSQSSYAMVIFMTAATTILAPPALKMLFEPAATAPNEETEAGSAALADRNARGLYEA